MSDAGVAGFADHQCLASSRRHESHPLGLVWLSGLVELSEFADLVHAHLVRLPAELASSCEESVYQLLASGGGSDWVAIPEDRGLLSSERDTTEGGDQRLPALTTVDADL